MKKIIVAAAAAFIVTFANAACVNWSVTDGTSVQLGYTVYLVGAISEYWESVADIGKSAAALGSGTSGSIQTHGRNYTTGTLSAEGDAITTESMKNAYMVIVSGADATSYNYVKFDMSGRVYVPPTSPSGTFSTTTATLLAGTKGEFGSSPNANGPEPTSGLLLLIGSAMLALRRRQK